jgi:hypothetical protein
MTKLDEQDRFTPTTSPALGLVADALDRLRFGSILLTVHDGKVMQIDVTERKRLTK